MDTDRILAAYQTARQLLLSQREAAGHWRGELASSALSTATAISALCATRSAGGPVPDNAAALIGRGLQWLDGQQNDDGGWGDTDRSKSNIATSMLVRACIHISGGAASREAALRRVGQYIEQAGELDGLRRRYGRDKTFAVPILSNCAVAGLVPWNAVAPLQFELACFPQSMYRFLQLPVVSYAIPALVAIGQSRHRHSPSRWPWMRWLRQAASGRSLAVLQRMQPSSGGYLEATPLTSFVVMNLASCGLAQHPVVRRGSQFIADSARADGSWPIDTDLATWNTTLSINALAAGGEDVAKLDCLPWLLECQHRQRHPFTGADPGGWGWTDLSGAVPDADDTPGALLALDAWRNSPSCTPTQRQAIERAASQGLDWLSGLQNRNGGWPTFCRGWGKLPFDRSGADLTAHALRALAAWRDRLPRRGLKNIARGVRYLLRVQRDDGSWLPLWFGNQDHPDEENPTYGTAKVLLAADTEGFPRSARERGLAWLEANQNPDGGWGGGRGPNGDGPNGDSSVEETALAVETLLALGPAGQRPADGSPLLRGLQWLLECVEEQRLTAAPIGFYFAKLWYHERLYPLIFATSCLGRAQQLCRELPPAAPADHKPLSVPRPS